MLRAIPVMQLERCIGKLGADTARELLSAQLRTVEEAGVSSMVLTYELLRSRQEIPDDNAAEIRIARDLAGAYVSALDAIGVDGDLIVRITPLSETVRTALSRIPRASARRFFGQLVDDDRSRDICRIATIVSEGRVVFKIGNPSSSSYVIAKALPSSAMVGGQLPTRTTVYSSSYYVPIDRTSPRIFVPAPDKANGFAKAVENQLGVLKLNMSQSSEYPDIVLQNMAVVVGATNLEENEIIYEQIEPINRLDYERVRNRFGPRVKLSGS